MSTWHLVGLTLVLGAAVACQSAKSVSLQPAPLAVQLTSQTGAVVGTVHLENGKPPALWPLRTIDRIEVTRAFPFREDVSGESHDHPHHRSMWAAHGDVNGVDFWHGEGRIQHDSVDVQDGECVVHGRWLDGHGKALLRSTLSYRVVDQGRTRRVDMELVLSPVDEPVVLGDTKEGTLAIRLAPQLRVDGAVARGTLTNSEGESGRSVWGQNAQWVEVRGHVDDRPVKLMLRYTGHVEPGNDFQLPLRGDDLSGAVRWHARLYGLIAANPFGERAFVGSGEAKETILQPGQRLILTLLATLEEVDVVQESDNEPAQVQESPLRL